MRPALGRSSSAGNMWSNDGHAVIVVERAGGADVTPIPLVVISIFRRAAELILGNPGAVAAELRAGLLEATRPNPTR